MRQQMQKEDIMKRQMQNLFDEGLMALDRDGNVRVVSDPGEQA